VAPTRTEIEKKKKLKRLCLCAIGIFTSEFESFIYYREKKLKKKRTASERKTMTANVTTEIAGDADLTRGEVGQLQLTCKLIAVAHSGNSVAVAHGLLLQQLLKELRWFRATRGSGDQSNYALLRNTHPLLVAAIAAIPARMLTVSRDEALAASDISSASIAQHISKMRQLLKQMTNVMIISCAHQQNGCPNASNCLFCV
jgi:hypothetical protein